MAKLSFYIIKYPLEYGCCTLFYFCHTKPKNTSHAKKQFPTQNYCTLSSPTEPPSLPTPPWLTYLPLRTTRKERFLDLSLQILNVMFLNYLTHPFVFLVLQHPKGLSFDLLPCISTNSQNVKHLAAAK